MKFHAEVRTPITRVLLREGEVEARNEPEAAQAARYVSGEYGTHVDLRDLNEEEAR